MRWIHKAHFDELFGTFLTELEDQFDTDVETNGYQPLIEGKDIREDLIELNRFWKEFEGAIWDISETHDMDTDVIDYLKLQAHNKTKIVVLNLLRVLSWTKAKVD